jgi:hypothetical protein
MYLLQATPQEAAARKEQAKQLAGDVASLLESYCVCHFEDESGWELLRPLLRLLLWLLPEHLPLSEPAAQTLATEQQNEAAAQSGRHTGGRHSQPKPAAVDCGWRDVLGRSFVLEVATVSQQPVPPVTDHAPEPLDYLSICKYVLLPGVHKGGQGDLPSLGYEFSRVLCVRAAGSGHCLLQDSEVQATGACVRR